MNDQIPEAVDFAFPLTSKRSFLAQVAVCKGCCCGNTERDKPPVPMDWLKQEWKSRGLAKFIQLTVSGCLGPCDLLNVVRISSGSDDIWLGHCRSLDDYAQIADWAEQSKAAGTLSALSKKLQQHRFTPFVTQNSISRVGDVPLLKPLHSEKV